MLYYWPKITNLNVGKVHNLRQIVLSIAAVLDELGPVFEILLASVLLVKFVEFTEHDAPVNKTVSPTTYEVIMDPLT